MIRFRPKPRPPIPPQTPGPVDFQCERIVSRLDRLQTHYGQLELMLDELEAKLPADNIPSQATAPRKPR